MEPSAVVAGPEGEAVAYSAHFFAITYTDVPLALKVASIFNRLLLLSYHKSRANGAGSLVVSA